MQLAPATLADRFVRLEPLGPHHREGLREACDADPALWRDLYPWSMAGEHFEPRFDWLVAENVASRFISFAVLANGKVGGMTSYLGIEPPNAALEIGATYYRPELRGGPVNPAAKRLLLTHAFDAGARRVQLKADALNTRSCAAIAKLGAVREGVLRQDRLTWTGRIRDTVVFSILADEWPAVRAGLDERLAGSG